MPQIFDVALNAKINEFVKKFGIIKTDDNNAEVFEDFQII